MRNEKVCVDASLIVALLPQEHYTNQAPNLWKAWIKQGATSPALAASRCFAEPYLQVDILSLQLG